MSEHIVIRVCPICGKKFVPAPFHLYKVGKRKVCSYTCTLPGAKEKKNKQEKGSEK